MKTTLTIAAVLLVAGCGDDTTNNYYPVEASPADQAPPDALPIVEKPVVTPIMPDTPIEHLDDDDDDDRPARRGRP